MSYVDFLYGDGTVLHQIFSYVRYESGHPWPPHMLLKFYWFAWSFNLLAIISLFYIWCYI